MSPTPSISAVSESDASLARSSPPERTHSTTPTNSPDPNIVSRFSQLSLTKPPAERPKRFQIENYVRPGIPRLHTPQLRRKKDPDYVPLLGFGFAITYRDIEEYVVRERLPDEWHHQGKRMEAFKRVLARIPWEYIRYAQLLHKIKFHEYAHFLLLATNQDAEDMKPAFDMDMIRKVYDILQTFHSPGWFFLIAQ